MHFIKERIGKLIDDLGGLIYPESVPVEQIRIMHSADGREDPAELDPSGWEAFERRDLWGGHREYYWFAFTAEIPEGWDEAGTRPTRSSARSSTDGVCRGWT